MFFILFVIRFLYHTNTNLALFFVIGDKAIEMTVLTGHTHAHILDQREEQRELSMLEVATKQSEAMAEEALKENIYTSVIYYGLVELDPEDNEKWQRYIYIAAFFAAVADALIAFLMPCMVDIEALVCE